MKDTHNTYDPQEEPILLDEVTGTNNSFEVSIITQVVEISDEEVLEILNYGLGLMKR
jgi:hypothetical protein